MNSSTKEEWFADSYETEVSGTSTVHFSCGLIVLLGNELELFSPLQISEP